MAKRKKSKGRSSMKSRNKRAFKAALMLVVAIISVIFVSSQLPSNDAKKAAATRSISDNVKKRLKEVRVPTSPKKRKSTISESGGVDNKSTKAKEVEDMISTPEGFGMPKITDDKYLHYNREGRFTVNYDPQNKIPSFVAHILTRVEASQSVVNRSTSFTSDVHYSWIGVLQATNEDYSRSGYDRGHMVPSADRNDTKVENRATFSLSNIAPQTPRLNRQTINMLEQQIREWAQKYDSLHIVTGAIVTDNKNRPAKTIGDGVAIPQYFYKVVAMRYKGEFKAVGFLMPNITDVDSDYQTYITTIDKIEEVAKIDLYHSLPDLLEGKMESEVDNSIWK